MRGRMSLLHVALPSSSPLILFSYACNCNTSYGIQFLPVDPVHMLHMDIVTIQWGGVSNKPPGLQAATRHGASDPLVR